MTKSTNNFNNVLADRDKPNQILCMHTINEESKEIFSFFCFVQVESEIVHTINEESNEILSINICFVQVDVFHNLNSSKTVNCHAVELMCSKDEYMQCG